VAAKFTLEVFGISSFPREKKKEFEQILKDCCWIKTTECPRGEWK